MSLLLSRRDLEFLLYEWLDVEALVNRPRYAEHDRVTFDAALRLSEDVATNHFAPHNKRNDVEEPTFVDGVVTVQPDVRPALEVFARTGLVAAGLDAEHGGMQLPVSVATAAFAWFQAANITTAAYPFLSLGVANLLIAHADPEQRDRYVPELLEGRCFGTMCLSEPEVGSSLGDVRVRAVPQSDGSYRVFGNKMWISGGEHDLSDNIVHLVLARVEGAPAGVKGLSLFIVPKILEDERGSGVRNDVVAAGLNHKMGYRGTTNCLLNFGEGRHRPGGDPGAVGFLVGDENRGLDYMFHLMNEARVGVGVGAVALGTTGYLHALEYARTRTQGRPLSQRDPASPTVAIIEHPDVRRMLLAQKAYVEGGMALSLFCASLLDDEMTLPDENERAAAHELLDVLTPIAKSWPSQWCVHANSLAIQVHGGYGYSREYNVEQFYRDNRLNPIHEGTHGIQALDLLGRKAIQHGGVGLRLLLERMTTTCERAAVGDGLPQDFAASLRAAALRIAATTANIWAGQDPDLALANASTYLEAVGHVVVAWLWLEQLLAVGDRAGPFYDAKRAAAAYFLRYELPSTGPMFDLLDARDRTVLDLDPSAL